VFESYEPGSEVVFSKNEAHFAADAFEFARLIWSIFGSGTAAVGAVENGNAAFTQGVQPQQYERAQETSNIEGKTNASYGWTGIFLNNSKSPFDSTSFRQALAHVVDTEDLVQVAISGYGEPARSPIAPSNEKWYNEDAPLLNGGLETARQVLYDDGYRWDEDGNLLAPV
jgi:ABC-type transport system substrate-binding protein